MSDACFAEQQSHQINVIIIVINREDNTALMARGFHSVRIDIEIADKITKNIQFSGFFSPDG
jgi:hypothetical protein